jgi:CheY-like chemotaxis protein
VCYKHIFLSFALRDTLQAATGEECLKFVRDQSKRYDLILMDQIMSGAGGVLLGTETTKLIRQYEAVENLPAHLRACIVGCSGNFGPDEAELTRDAGMNGALTKPIPQQQQLFGFLRDLLLETHCL